MLDCYSLFCNSRLKELAPKNVVFNSIIGPCGRKEHTDTLHIPPIDPFIRKAVQPGNSERHTGATQIFKLNEPFCVKMQ